MEKPKITRVIPQAYHRDLTLIKYLVGEADPKNANLIIKAMI